MHINPVHKMVTARIPTTLGEFRLSLFHHGQDEKEHIALVRGNVAGQQNVLIRVHSECFTGDVLASERCDCGDQLGQALALIDQEGCGAVIYLRQEGRGIGLIDKLKAYNLQDMGYDTVDANRLLGHAPDAREYSIAAQILEDLEILSIRLMTNNPAKVDGLVDSGIRITERVPIRTAVKAENAAYLKTKADRMRHIFDGISEILGERPQNPPRLHSPAEDSRDVPEIQAPSLINELAAAAGSFRHEQKRPFVTLTYAQSVDGCIAVEADQPLAISGPESFAFTHQLRAVHDAILVGIGTVLADDPRLTARLENATDPQPVVLDSQLRFPLEARLLSGSSPWIATSEDADPKRQAALEAMGARILRLPSDNHGKIGLEPLLQKLHSLGINSLMVEGGAAVISSFLASQQVDHFVLTVAPTLIGGVPAVGRHRNGGRAHLPQLRDACYRQLGKDLILWGAPEWA